MAPLDEPFASPAPSGPAPGISVLERELLEEQVVEPGDHERLSHYARKDKITEAMVLGTPVVALCGKVWVPSRDPQKFPVCPTCKEIYEGIAPGDDEE
jgi:hypothetical protein